MTEKNNGVQYKLGKLTSAVESLSKSIDTLRTENNTSHGKIYDKIDENRSKLGWGGFSVAGGTGILGGLIGGFIKSLWPFGGN